jgi:hypothetical protein
MRKPDTAPMIAKQERTSPRLYTRDEPGPDVFAPAIVRMAQDGRGMRWIAIALALGAQTANLPPPFPREGAALMFQNDRVQVWDIAWLRQQYPLHHHIYDLVGVFYSPGDRIIVSDAGERRRVTTAAWSTAFQRRGLTHTEEGASDPPLRAVFIEITADPRREALDAPGTPPFPAGSGNRLVDNDRAAIWEFAPAPIATAHRHHHDAVVVAFAAGKPTVSFTPAGTTHNDEGLGSAARVYVFEIK